MIVTGTRRVEISIPADIRGVQPNLSTKSLNEPNKLWFYRANCHNHYFEKSLANLFGECFYGQFIWFEVVRGFSHQNGLNSVR